MEPRKYALLRAYGAALAKKRATASADVEAKYEVDKARRALDDELAREAEEVPRG